MAVERELAVKEDLELGHGTVNITDPTDPTGASLTGNKIGLHTFSDRVYSSGDFATIAAALSQLSSDGGGILVIEPGSYTEDLTIPSNVYVIGAGRGLVTITGDVTLQGTLGAANSYLTTAGAAGDKTVVVNDGTQFSANDWVKIEGSTSEDDNSTKAPQRELNQVVSIATNTLTLKYPLAHDYPIGFSPEPDVTVVDTVKQDIILQGVTIVGSLDFGYTRRVVFRDVEASDIGTSGTVTNGIRIEGLRLTNSIGAGATTMCQLHGLRFFHFENLECWGGSKDHFRLYGCADGYYSGLRSLECDNRSVWFYKSRNISGQDLEILGSQAETTNIEILLFDYSANIKSFGGKIFEPNKDTSVNAIEFRGDSAHCSVLDMELHLHGDTGIIYKAESASCKVQDCRIYQYGSFVASVENMGTAGGPLFLVGNRVTYAGSQTGVTLLRTGASTEPSAEHEGFIVERNVIDRGDGTFISLAGTGGGTAVKKVVLRDNLSLEGDASTGSLTSAMSLNIAEFFCVNNQIEDGADTRDLLVGAGIAEAHVIGNRAGELNVSDWTAIKTLKGNFFDTDPWQAPSYNAGWQDGSGGEEPVSFMTDGEFLYMAGVAEKTSAIADNDVIFTLPAGFRPSSVQWVVTTAATDFAWLTIAASGDVTLQNPANTGGNDKVALNIPPIKLY